MATTTIFTIRFARWQGGNGDYASYESEYYLDVAGVGTEFKSRAEALEACRKLAAAADKFGVSPVFVVEGE